MPLFGKEPEALADCAKPFDGSKNYQKVIRFGSTALREQLDKYIVLIKERQRQIAVQREQQEAERQKQLAEQEAERERQLAEQEAERKRLIAEFKDRLVHLSPEDKNTPAYQRLAGKADALKEKEQATMAYRTALENVNREKPRLQAEIEEKKKQKASLSIFSGKEKKEVQQKIDELSLRLAELENGLSTAEEAKARAGEACFALEVYTKMVLLKNKPGLLQKLQELGVTEIELQQLDVPQTIEFGRYIQDENGLATPIEWLVLDYAADRVLLLSRYALDCQPYEKIIFKKNYTWETSSLREWLNGDFINAAFSAEEKAMIPSVTVSANRNPDCSRDPGNDTEDKVFLLGILEAEKYFQNDEARICVPTAYAIANCDKKNRVTINYTQDGTATCRWWLREPAGPSNNIINSAYVSGDGDVNSYGESIMGENCVRPALWIDISD